MRGRFHDVEGFCHSKPPAINLSAEGALQQLELLSYYGYYVNGMLKGLGSGPRGGRPV